MVFVKWLLTPISSSIYKAQLPVVYGRTNKAANHFTNTRPLQASKKATLVRILPLTFWGKKTDYFKIFRQVKIIAFAQLGKSLFGCVIDLTLSEVNPVIFAMSSFVKFKAALNSLNNPCDLPKSI